MHSLYLASLGPLPAIVTPFFQQRSLLPRWSQQPCSGDPPQTKPSWNKFWRKAGAFPSEGSRKRGVLTTRSKMLEVSPKATLEWEHKKIINLSKNEIMSILPTHTMSNSLSEAACATLLLSAPNTSEEDDSITNQSSDSRNWKASFTRCLGDFPGIPATTRGLCGVGLQSLTEIQRAYWGLCFPTPEGSVTQHQATAWMSLLFVPPQSKAGITPPSRILKLNLQHLQGTNKPQAVSPSSSSNQHHFNFLQRTI